MFKAVLPLCLVLAAGTSLACPGSGKAMDAKADGSPSVTAALPAKPQQNRAAVSQSTVDPKKIVNVAVVKKPTF